MRNYCTTKTDGKKWCPQCKKYKDYSEFYTNKTKRDGLCTECKECHLLGCKKYRTTKSYKIASSKSYFKHRDKNALKRKAYYEANKHIIAKKRNKHRENRTEWFFNQAGGYCRYCGYNKTFAALQLHHLDNREKENGRDVLSNWVKWVSLDKFKKKIKSISFTILCSNCHTELHTGYINKVFKPIIVNFLEDK